MRDEGKAPVVHNASDMCEVPFFFYQYYILLTCKSGPTRSEVDIKVPPLKKPLEAQALEEKGLATTKIAQGEPAQGKQGLIGDDTDRKWTK